MLRNPGEAGDLESKVLLSAAEAVISPPARERDRIALEAGDCVVVKDRVDVARDAE